MSLNAVTNIQHIISKVHYKKNKSTHVLILSIINPINVIHTKHQIHTIIHNVHTFILS